MSLREQLMDYTEKELFDNTWGKAVSNRFMRQQKGGLGTATVKDILRNTPDWQKQYEGHISKAIASMKTKAMTMSGVSAAIPIIFDPEVISLLQSETPFLDLIDHEGYQGYTVRVDNISARDDPVGFQAEADVLTLSTAKDVTFAVRSADMKIFVDKAQISDFGQMGSEHFLNLRDTTLGERIAAGLQYLEQCMLYGDPSQAGSDGSPYDTNAFQGMAKTFTTAGTNVDRSDVASDFLGDIKGYIAALLQSGYAVNPNDLIILCSETMYDALEEDAAFYGRWMINDDKINYGGKGISIRGVPVFPGKNIRTHTFNSTDVGDDGDVFIINKRASKMKLLAPLSMIPLARDGLSENVALFQFSTYIDRAYGYFGRYLQAYNI